MHCKYTKSVVLLCFFSLIHIINKGREQQALCQIYPCFLFIFPSIVLLPNYIVVPVGEGPYHQIFAKRSAAAATIVAPKSVPRALLAECEAHFNNGVALGRGFPSNARIDPAACFWAERRELGQICLPP